MEDEPAPQQPPQQQHATVQPSLHLAVHTVEAATAKVPFSIVLLLDLVKRNAIPEGMRVRMVVPSDGLVSMSLWDTSNPAALKQWLDENLGGDSISEVYEVAEDFTYGVMLEVGRARAAERVAGNTTRTIGALGEKASTATAAVKAQLRDFDQRTGVITSARETTAQAAKTISTTVQHVAKDERVQNVVTNVSKGMSAGWTRVTAGAAWLGGRVAQQLDSAGRQDGQGVQVNLPDDGYVDTHAFGQHRGQAQQYSSVVPDEHDRLDHLPELHEALPHEPAMPTSARPGGQ